MYLIPPFLLIFITVLGTNSFVFSEAEDCKGGNHPHGVAHTIVVDKSGRGSFKTIQSAINSIPSNNDRWIKVRINPGVYVEQVTIPKDKPCLFLEGTNRDKTIIAYNAHSRTDASPTFTSNAEYIIAKLITFKNSFNLKLDKLNMSLEAASRQKKQAVAAKIGGDKSAFLGCSFLGVQDTLWDAAGRHLFKKCHIEGAIDFIFGNGQSIYQDCHIVTTSGVVSPRISYGYITAQGRWSKDDPSGFVFAGGKIDGNTPVYLGRAYGPYSRVIFDHTHMGSIVKPEGWEAWDYAGKESKIMYVEINCTGPGAKTWDRIKWEKRLDLEDLNQFRTFSFIDKEGYWLGKLPRY